MARILSGAYTVSKPPTGSTPKLRRAARLANAEVLGFRCVDARVNHNGPARGTHKTCAAPIHRHALTRCGSDAAQTHIRAADPMCHLIGTGKQSLPLLPKADAVIARHTRAMHFDRTVS